MTTPYGHKNLTRTYHTPTVTRRCIHSKSHRHMFTRSCSHKITHADICHQDHTPTPTRTLTDTPSPSVSLSYTRSRTRHSDSFTCPRAPACLPYIVPLTPATLRAHTWLVPLTPSPPTVPPLLTPSPSSPLDALATLRAGRQQPAWRAPCPTPAGAPGEEPLAGWDQAPPTSLLHRRLPLFLPCGGQTDGHMHTRSHAHPRAPLAAPRHQSVPHYGPMRLFTHPAGYG